MHKSLKILVTSQKGGVGKSTVSANLAAFFQVNEHAVTLIDFDTHGSSSTWLKHAPAMGITIQHHPLPLHQGGNRPILDARLHLRRASSCFDVAICDLTWTDSIAGELLFDFDIVIVPTSVSEIELAATAGFLNHHKWVFDSKIHVPPTLLLAPTRVNFDQLNDNTFSVQRFPVSFMLTPPILEAQSAKEMFERGYLMDLQDACGESFIAFGNAVNTAHQIRKQMLISRKNSSSTRYRSTPNRFTTAGTLSEQQTVLSRYRNQQIQSEKTPIKTTLNNVQAQKLSTSNQGAFMRLLQKVSNNWNLI